MRSPAQQAVHEGRIGGSVPERRSETSRPDLEGNWRHPRHHERGTKSKMGRCHRTSGHRGCGSHGSLRWGRHRSTGERNLLSGPLGRGCSRSDGVRTLAPVLTRQRRLLPGTHRDDRGHGRGDRQPIDAARGSDVLRRRIERLEEAGPPAHDEDIREGPEADARGEHGVRVHGDPHRGVDDPAASEQAKKQHRCEYECHRGEAEQPEGSGRVSTIGLAGGVG